jgi:hypothetical protein
LEFFSISSIVLSRSLLFTHQHLSIDWDWLTVCSLLSSFTLCLFHIWIASQRSWLVRHIVIWLHHQRHSSSHPLNPTSLLNSFLSRVIWYVASYHIEHIKHTKSLTHSLTHSQWTHTQHTFPLLISILYLNFVWPITYYCYSFFFLKSIFCRIMIL